MIPTVFHKTIWDRRKSILWWCLGLIGMTLLTMASYPTVLDQRETYESLLEGAEGFAAIFGFEAVSELFDPAGYMVSNLYAQTLLIVLMVFTIGIGAASWSRRYWRLAVGRIIETHLACPPSPV